MADRYSHFALCVRRWSQTEMFDTSCKSGPYNTVPAARLTVTTAIKYNSLVGDGSDVQKGALPPPLPLITYLSNITLFIMPPSPDEIYCRLLFTKNKKGGYPLWIPEPNKALPKACQERGVTIGDVGLITDDGQFDFLFNICEEETHPVNGGPSHSIPGNENSHSIGDGHYSVRRTSERNNEEAANHNFRTPPGFTPVVLNPTKDLKVVEVMYPPGSDVSSTSMRRIKVVADGGVENSE